LSFHDLKRLPPETFSLDVDRITRGHYSDFYFVNMRTILEKLGAEGYRFSGRSPVLGPLQEKLGAVNVGDVEADVQVFTKGEPFSIVSGVDYALAIIKECTGFFDPLGMFVPTSDRLDVEALHEGAKVAPLDPVMRIRGRYRDFAILETLILGVLAHHTRIASNVYRALEAASGKPVLYFPARMCLPSAQSGDGFAYKIAVDRYNHDFGRNVLPFISTDAQGQWWGAGGGGTTSHSLLVCFLRDTAEAMMAFARILPAGTRRIALVDVNNDCVGDSLATARRMFARYRQLTDAGDHAQAAKYVLFGVRLDTAEDMVDKSIGPSGDPDRNAGVSAQLVRNVRRALDEGYRALDIPPEWVDRARDYFRNVKIIATGGFTPDRIARFEADGVPADVYGIGSYFAHGRPNDYTADLIRVKLAGKWYDMAKEGRRARTNPDLERVRL